LVTDVLTLALSTGLETVFLADWNSTPDASYLVQFAMTGAIRLLDEVATVPLVTTRGGSYLDYGFASNRMPCLERQLRWTSSQHALVLYRVAWSTGGGAVYSGPCRAARVQLSEADAAKTCALVDRALVDFEALTNVDDAWTCLSVAIEKSAYSCSSSDVPRSESWSPQLAAACHHSAKTSQSFRLRRLLRLARRLEQLSRADSLVLRRKCLRGCRSLAAGSATLLSVDLYTVEEALPEVYSLAQALQDHETRTRLCRWQARMAVSLRACRTWVRRPESYVSLPATPTPSTPVHPFDRLLELSRYWASIWDRHHPADDVDLQHFDENDVASFASAYRHRLFEDFPEVSEREAVDWQACISATTLRARAARMKGKAPGLDDWTADEFLAQPLRWWHCFARLWIQVLREGQLPARWCEARIVFLQKPTATEMSVAAVRPLSIAQVAWRIGASVLARWAIRRLLRVLPTSVAGGIPSRSVHQIFARVLARVHDDRRLRRHSAFIAQDITKCFDSLQVRQTLVTAYRLGLPSALLNVILQFYSRGRRLLRFNGTFSEGWRPHRHGLLQGCPFSPVLLACVMSGWCRRMMLHHFQTSVYLDDRLFWASVSWCLHRCKLIAKTAASCRTVVQRALQASDDFDTIHGLATSPAKCGVAATSASGRIADLLGYADWKTSLVCLGMCLHLSRPDHSRCRRLQLQHLEVRAHRIAVVTRRPEFRRHLLVELVISAFRWAAGIAFFTQVELSRLSSMIRRAALPRHPRNLAEVLVWEVVGYANNPWVALAWQMISAWLGLCRDLTCCASWTSSLSTLDLSSLPSLLPQWPHLCHYMDWRLEVATQTLCTPRGPFRIGLDAPATLRTLLIEKCRAVQLRHSRVFAAPRDRLGATGLRLPPPEHRVLYAKVHCEWFGRPFLLHPEGRLLALGSGLDAWYWQARSHLPATRRLHCTCGAPAPSASHLLWSCPALPSIPVRAPRDRAEDRLWTPTVSPEPVQLHLPELIDLPLQQLLAITADSDGVFATDGGAAAGYSSWAVATFVQGHLVAVAGQIPSLDSSPFTAECTALQTLLRAARMTSRRSFHVLVDNQALVAAASGSARLHYRWSLDYDCSWARIEAGVSFTWIPAHGRRPTWTSPISFMSAADARKLNEAADAACSRVLFLCQHRDLPRQLWQRECAEASRWATEVLNSALRRQDIMRSLVSLQQSDTAATAAA
jgi:hypothetical protein